MSGVDARRVGNLPNEVSSFIGRRREVAEVKRLLSDAQLVTLTGFGGVGKTRLALRAASEVLRMFPDGVWFVDLTALRAPDMFALDVQDLEVLAYLVRAALGLREQGGGPPLRQLAEQLAGWRALLVLDNCEHVIPAGAMLADTLLRNCPHLRVLATSREPLAVAGERSFVVPPMSAPMSESARRAGPAELTRYDSVALFVARAQAVVADFALTDENRNVVVELCGRLDGLPLAIELAAARIRVLAPRQILDRLGDRFAMLGRGSRAAPERQQSLRACVEWSFELCAKPERILWARSSVFVGGFQLDAVEGICADEHLPEADVLDLVAGLVDKSILLRAEQDGGEARYQMLETIRDFGEERLVAAGEQVELRRRHRDWYEGLAARAQAEWLGGRQPYWLDRLAREQPNLRVAIDYCLTEPEEVEAALRLLVAVPRTYWWSRGLFGEVRRWLDRALAHTEAGVPASVLVRALTLAAGLAMFQGDVDTASRLLDQALDLAQARDPRGLGRVVLYRGMAALFRADLPTALDLHEEAVALLSATPLPDLELQLALLISLGSAAVMKGDLQRAGACFQEVLATTEPRGEIYYQSLALWHVARIALHQGEPAQATPPARESLRLRRAHGSLDRYNIAGSLEELAWIAASQRQHRRAAILLGAADALWSDAGVSVAAALMVDHDTWLRQARGGLGHAAFTAAFDHGRSLPFEVALDYALDERREPTAQPLTDTSTPLTRRERQIADLIAQGMSNKEIAGTLVISQRTVESHVEHILTKLGFASRAQVAAWIAEQRPGTGKG